MSCYIKLTNIKQSFAASNAHVSLFENLDIKIEKGNSYAITGPSGAGKSSLLMLLSGLENPTSGIGIYHNQEQDHSLSSLKSEVGFIFQQFHLLPELTALNNVALPLKLRGDKHAISKAKTWLTKVGLQHRENHKPNQLSGGEQQRVAIARALVFNPKFIFADEPTGNLDSASAIGIADILFDCCKENKAGLVIVTHSDALAKRAQQVFNLSNGQLETVKNLGEEV